MENKVQWICATVLLSLLIISPTSCTYLNNQKIAEAIEQGYHPIEAACAYSSQQTELEKAACAQILTKPTTK